VIVGVWRHPGHFSFNTPSCRACIRHLIDMGPGGGSDGGRILAAGTPEDVARAPASVTGPYLAGSKTAENR
jgi:hypothetical protein